MTFKEALKKLREIAKERYCRLRYEVIVQESGKELVEIQGYIIHNEYSPCFSTFQEVLDFFEGKTLVDKAEITDEV